MSENKIPIGEEATKFDIHVLSQDESIIILRMSPNMIMEKLFKSYCKKKQIIDYKTIQFLFDGQHISPKMIIHELGLKDGDQIDAMLHQTGGGFTN
ncbi:hypothetical protein H5410_048951 [Solanum commersonii]|uniref:Ubiquitin-like domain-containing protein n=1 Tax=Solanum commersonii TaxID=4109 RepID=A0A9J5XL08_SOLCO|nr:hypothetical protein H5410_048951 [Solanum commersonii]